MTVYTDVAEDGKPVNIAGARVWVNAKSVRECAELALHRAAREGWRGRVRVAAWTDTMRKEGHALGLVYTITDEPGADIPRFARPTGGCQHDPRYLDQR